MAPPKKTILIIDDEEDFRSMVGQICKEVGYDVLQAENGMDGLELARAKLPDLVVCDITMPKLDGRGLIKVLRENPETANIPFIFLTGLTDLSDLRTGMQLGADDYLTKPVDADQLLKAIEVRLKKMEDIEHQLDRRLEEIRLSILDSLPHELRTPLHGILGFSEILKTGHAELKPNEIEEIAARIHKAAMRLKRLFENFLLYAELQIIVGDEQRKKQLRTNRTASFRVLVENTVGEAARKWNRPGDVALNLQDASVAIAEPHLMKIVEELADNAFKFSEARTPVEVAARRTDSTVTLTVSDKGRGMTATQVRGTGGFTQFGRSVYEQQGMGMGLALARLVVEVYGGTLTIESEPQKGTRVSVTLPIVS